MSNIAEDLQDAKDTFSNRKEELERRHEREREEFEQERRDAIEGVLDEHGLLQVNKKLVEIREQTKDTKTRYHEFKEHVKETIYKAFIGDATGGRETIEKQYTVRKGSIYHYDDSNELDIGTIIEKKDLLLQHIDDEDARERVKDRIELADSFRSDGNKPYVRRERELDVMWRGYDLLAYRKGDLYVTDQYNVNEDGYGSGFGSPYDSDDKVTTPMVDDSGKVKTNLNTVRAVAALSDEIEAFLDDIIEEEKRRQEQFKEAMQDE